MVKEELNTRLVEEMELSAERRQIIENLTIENLALTDRWNKLKEWVNARYNDYRFEGHIVSPEIEELDVITNKMLELEKSDKTKQAKLIRRKEK